MTTIVLDTETTGFPLWREDDTHPGQPRIVQLAWLVLDDSLRVVEAHSVLVDHGPGLAIQAEASAVHGITETMLSEYGTEAGGAFGELDAWINSPSSIVNGTRIVAHNADFDRKMLDIENARWGLPKMDPARWSCTMRPNILIVQAPFPEGKRETPDGRGRNGDWKFPSLAETYRHYFGEELRDAHDALTDVIACARIWREMQARGVAS